MSLQGATFSQLSFLPGHEYSMETIPESSRVSFDLRRIGGILREARERKGLSLSDVAGFLFIKKSTVDSIESGDWGILPHPVYVKGYIKSYAAYLGVYKRIEQHLCLNRGGRPGEGSEDDRPVPALDAEKPGRDEGPRSLPRLSLRKIAIICSSVVGLVLGIALSPGLQIAAPAILKEVLTACHVAATGLVRRVILP